MYQDGLTLAQLIELFDGEPLRIESKRAGLYEFQWIREAHRATVWMDGNSSVGWDISR